MNAYELESPERKLVMWYKCKEKFDLGLSKAQIARELGIDVKTVRHYLKMNYDEFKSSASYKRMYMKVLDPYESKVYGWMSILIYLPARYTTGYENGMILFRK